MSDEITYEWLDGPESQGPRPATKEEWAAIDSLLSENGWMSLNRSLTRVLVARKGEEKAIVGFHVLQLLPHTEPLYVVPEERGTKLADTLATKMVEFLVEAKARGWMAIADSPHAAKLCEEHGMVRLKSPVYITETK